MLSTEAVARSIEVAEVPILFLDTCIFLDIIRSTSRGLENYAKHASNLLEHLSAKPPTCQLLVSSIVPSEWSKHNQRVAKEIKAHLTTIENQSGHFHDACEALGIDPGFGRANYSRVGLADGLLELAKKLMNAALVLGEDDESKLKAFKRLSESVPPSSKGGQMQDCLIVEQCLALSRRLHQAGFRRRKVFCTSNTNDYCDGGRKPHAVLSDEFIALDLKFTTNLGWAVREMRN